MTHTTNIQTRGNYDSPFEKSNPYPFLVDFGPKAESAKLVVDREILKYFMYAKYNKKTGTLTDSR
jgi:hypothetical protein